MEQSRIGMLASVIVKEDERLVQAVLLNSIGLTPSSVTPNARPWSVCDPLHAERGGKLAEQRLGVHCSALLAVS